MRSFAKVSPKFFTGRLGLALRGDTDAIALAFYLIAGPQANSVGLYRLPPALAEADLGVPRATLDRGSKRLHDAGFSRWDLDTERVWVVHHMRHQWSGLNDAQRKHVQAVLAEHAISNLVNDFVAMYGDEYGLVVPTLARGSGEGRVRVGRPTRDTETETETEREMDGGGEGPAGAREAGDPDVVAVIGPPPDGNTSQMRVYAIHELLVRAGVPAESLPAPSAVGKWWRDLDGDLDEFFAVVEEIEGGGRAEWDRERLSRWLHGCVKRIVRERGDAERRWPVSTTPTEARA